MNWLVLGANLVAGARKLLAMPLRLTGLALAGMGFLGVLAARVCAVLADVVEGV